MTAPPLTIQSYIEGLGSTYKLLEASRITPAVGVLLFRDEAEADYVVQVFGGELRNQLERYATVEEAYAGHKAMVERARDAAEE
jgi:hypothetical protein